MTKFTRLTQKRRNYQTKTPNLFSRFKFDLSKISMIIFFSLIISGFAYLALINNVSTGGFEIKELEQQVKLLNEQNKKLEIEAAKLQSMRAVASASDKLELVEAGEVEYLEVTPPVVALGQ